MESKGPQHNLKTRTTHVTSLEKGKIPPQAIDLEEVVLGALMIDKKGVDEVLYLLKADVFYRKAHKHILIC
jgi:replicative DNA helicase